MSTGTHTIATDALAAAGLHISATARTSANARSRTVLKTTLSEVDVDALDASATVAFYGTLPSIAGPRGTRWRVVKDGLNGRLYPRVPTQTQVAALRHATGLQ